MKLLYDMSLTKPGSFPPEFHYNFIETIEDAEIFPAVSLLIAIRSSGFSPFSDQHYHV